MPTVRQSISMSIGGLSLASLITRSGSGQISVEKKVSETDADKHLTPATAGTLTTRTDNNTGVVTSTSHGLATNDKVDVYWSDGIRYDMDATVSGSAVTVDGGAGDNLPALSTAVFICKQTTINVDFDGDDVEVLAALCNVRGHLLFEESDGTDIAETELTAGESYSYTSETNATNPFTGDPVGLIKASVGSAATTAYLRLGVLLNT